MDKVENKWQIKYQSTTSTIQHAVVYRTHMQRQRWPPFAPLQDEAFSFLWDNPHHTVWFPATLSTNTANVCHPPPFLDPISFIIQTMQRTKDARGSMSGNKKWEDLLRYHDINENIRNPSNHSIMNIIDTFASYDNASFPCTDEDTEHGGLGSHYSILARATAFHHALSYEQIPNMTSDALANCNCVTHATNRF